MRNVRRVLFAILLLAMLGALTWEVFLPPPEPMYEGKPLSFWLEGYNYFTRTETSQQQADNAMSAIGTNAIPTLLEMLQANDSRFKQEFFKLIRKQSVVSTHFRTDADYHMLATDGFYGLGPNGKPAVPALIQLLKATNLNTRLEAADCLGYIGSASEAAVPILVQFLDDTNRYVRLLTTRNLGKIHMEPEIVVPILIQNLKGQDAAFVRETVRALGEFGNHAKSAIPALLPFLNDNDASVRSETTNAIKRIDPETAAKIFGESQITVK